MDSVPAATSDTSMGMLERRRIEAGIIAPIYRALVEELGSQRAAAILARAIAEDARLAGQRMAAQEPGGASLRTFIGIQELWTRGGALQTEIVEQTDDAFAFNVHHCAYAQMYRDMGLADIGSLLSCVRDKEFITGYDPTLSMTRSQTIMQGATHCDFRYTRTSQA